MDELKALYGDLYTEQNVMITATHTHAAPGGMHTYWVYEQPTGGIISLTFDIYVKGIVEVGNRISILINRFILNTLDIYINSLTLNCYKSSHLERQNF